MKAKTWGLKVKAKPWDLKVKAETWGLKVKVKENMSLEVKIKSKNHKTVPNAALRSRPKTKVKD